VAQRYTIELSRLISAVRKTLYTQNNSLTIDLEEEEEEDFDDY
jgi:hypothetical protein